MDRLWQARALLEEKLWQGLSTTLDEHVLQAIHDYEMNYTDDISDYDEDNSDYDEEHFHGPPSHAPDPKRQKLDGERHDAGRHAATATTITASA